MYYLVAGLNLNLIALIQSDEVHKLLGLNDLIDFCLSRHCLVTRIEKAGTGGIVKVQTRFFSPQSCIVSNSFFNSMNSKT